MTKNYVNVCLIVEDSYPYINNELAFHIHETIKATSSIKFLIIYLDTLNIDQQHLKFDLPPNVFSLDFISINDLSLFDANRRKLNYASITKSLDVIQRFHTQKNVDENRQLLHITQELSDPKRVDYYKLFNSEQGWDFILNQYENICPDGGFRLYYEHIANLHYPMFKISRIVKQQSAAQASLYHCWSSQYSGFMGMLLSKRFNRPLLLSELTPQYKIQCFLRDFATYSHRQSAEKSHRIDIKHKNQVSNQFGRRLASLTYRQASHVIAYDAQVKALQESLGGDQNSLHMCHYGIDVQKLKRLALRRKMSVDKKIALIGSMQASQDILRFIKAIAVLRTTHTDLKAVIVVKGEVDEQYQNNCLRLIKILKLDDSIEVKSYKSLDAHLVDIHILVSCAVENLQYHILLSAMALEIPVVLPKISPFDEVLEHASVNKDYPHFTSVDSFTDSENIAAIVNAWFSTEVDHYMEDLKKIGAYVKNKYAIKNTARTYLNIYQSVKEHVST